MELRTSGGTLGYDRTGDPAGPLVVLSPGFGDLRSTYAGLAAALAAAGCDVVTADLRGHGGSSVGWPGYSVDAVAGDLLALLHAHGGRGVLVGNSYSGSAAVRAAAREPGAVAGLVLSGAFVRDQAGSPVQRVLVRLFSRTVPGRWLWTTAAWPSLFRSRPADFAARRAELRTNLARPGGYEALRRMTTPEGNHAGTEPLLGAVRAPALVVMGTRDPDFPDPAAEARFTADALGGDAQVLLVDGAGHYPHTEAVDAVAPAVADFVRAVSAADRGGA
ncbi:MAG: Beta-ketoadipate enol-lactone hydrolase [uncultured Corynebacteriales bacterium]|uniref:Beta-ketoadipate enol-lactone hydrolase n=1 Tax=uncultured Mycobacteriales bacterium TaxID=581187 RepID=A0A6J4JF51_9ACTN|nr:MAG: Beta-ketoadipate enol-lactone hydrolase [uncultured Corynebacteriales bacterium]